MRELTSARRDSFSTASSSTRRTRMATRMARSRTSASVLPLTARGSRLCGAGCDSGGWLGGWVAALVNVVLTAGNSRGVGRSACASSALVGLAGMCMLDC
jgi:hypothetical protein